MKVLPQKFDGIKTYSRCAPKEATHVVINVPGSRLDGNDYDGSGVVHLPVLPNNEKRAGTNCWSWNCDVEKPTFRPSLLMRRPGFVSHSWITDGQVKFLGDCTHGMAGQTLDLLDLPDWWD